MSQLKKVKYVIILTVFIFMIFTLNDKVFAGKVDLSSYDKVGSVEEALALIDTKGYEYAMASLQRYYEKYYIFGVYLDGSEGYSYFNKSSHFKVGDEFATKYRTLDVYVNKGFEFKNEARCCNNCQWWARYRASIQVGRDILDGSSWFNKNAVSEIQKKDAEDAQVVINPVKKGYMPEDNTVVVFNKPMSEGFHAAYIEKVDKENGVAYVSESHNPNQWGGIRACKYDKDTGEWINKICYKTPHAYIYLTGASDPATTEDDITDNESESFGGKILNEITNLVQKVVDTANGTLAKEFGETSTTRTMFDLNQNDDIIESYTDNTEKPYVEAPQESDIKLFAKTDKAIQHFAITDIGTSNQLVWIGRNPSYDPQNFSIDIYKDASTSSSGNKTATITLARGGHQALSVWKNGNSYNIYTGAYGKYAGVNHNRKYYLPTGVNQLVITSTDKNVSKNFAKEAPNAIDFDVSNINGLGIDEVNNKMAVQTNANVKIYDLDKNKLSNSKFISNFKIRNGVKQGACLVNNYFYYIGSMNASNMNIGCYDISTGEEVWYETLDLSSEIGGDYEPEGIQVYNYQGRNRIFIGFNGGHGIWYFDTPYSESTNIANGDVLGSIEAWTKKGGKVYQKYAQPDNKPPYVGTNFMKEYNSFSKQWRGYTKNMKENYCCVGAEVTLYHILLDAGYSQEQIENIMPMKGQTKDAISWAKDHEVWHLSGSSYTPKPGDIITFNKGKHTELVTKVTEKSVKTINLNAGKKISEGYKSYLRKSKRIYGYIEVRY